MTDATIKHIATLFPINADALKPDPKLHRRRSILREFSLNTTAHGIPGIARSKSIHNRVFWALSSVAFTGIMIYFITQSIIAYFSYATQTSVAENDEWPQAFPAVSICNYSPLRYDRFREPFLNYTKSLNLTDTNDTSTFSRMQASYIRDFFQYKLNNGELLNDYLFSLSSILIGCVYNGKNCSADDFVSFLSPYYGFCYTINAQSNRIRNGSLFYNTDNGDFGILKLQLYTHSHQYVPYFSDAAGVVIVIHDNREVPLTYPTELFLEPGKKHKVGYTKKTTYSLGSPFTKCSNEIPAMLKPTLTQFGDVDYAYSDSFCYLICAQIYIHATCGCVNPVQWSARRILRPGTTEAIDAPLCNLTDPCYREAAVQFQVDATIWASYCSVCTPQCSSTKFLTKLSFLSAPSDWLIDDIKTFVESSSVPRTTNWTTTWQSDIQKSYVAIDVVCEITLVENYTQAPSVSGIDLISNIGGHTGLWIGISFLSLMELIEMLYRLIRYHCHVLGRRVRGEHDEHL